MDELANIRAGDRLPCFLQGTTELLPILFRRANCCELRIELMDRTFQLPPHVLNRIEIRRVGGEINDLNSMLLQELSCCDSSVYGRVIL